MSYSFVGVQIVYGFLGRSGRPMSSLTRVLQEAVRRVRPEWETKLPHFFATPAGDSGQVVLGVGSGHVPKLTDTLTMVDTNSALSKAHYVHPAMCSMGAFADQRRTGTALSEVLNERAGDLKAAGFVLDAALGRPAFYLISDDGRAGAIVCGRAIWKAGPPYDEEGLQTYRHRYGPGEEVRLVGKPYLTVDAASPVMLCECHERIRETSSDVGTFAFDGQFLSDVQGSLTKAMGSPAGCGWYLHAERRETDDAPTPS